MKDKRPSVLLISVDAMKPEFIFKAEERGVKLPNIQKYFVENGTYASEGMQGVFPSITYPSHQSMITGTNPVKHGTENNTMFDPFNVHHGAWIWNTTKEVKTLWDGAKESGYITASVSFPASGGAKGDYIAPEFWFDGTEFDSALVDMMCTPQGLVSEMEKEIGRYACGYYLDDESDEQCCKEVLWMMEHKLKQHLPEKPFFLSGYFAGFDTSMHNHGVYAKEPADTLMKIDRMLGQIIEKAHKITDGNVVVCVVSDHGSMDNERCIFPNVLFRQNGLIDVDEKGNVTGWKAYSQNGGGTCEIRIKDKEDKETYSKVKALLDDLKNERTGGVAKVLTHEECIEKGGMRDADFALIMKKGCEPRDEAVGTVYTSLEEAGTYHHRAMHGYDELYEEMRASFLIEGVGIQKQRDLGLIKLVDVAPTLAAIMGFRMEDADGRNVL